MVVFNRAAVHGLQQSLFLIHHATAVRNMATLKDIQLRLKSIKNIEKITKSMKMIASTKLSRAQKAMEVGRVYGMASNNIYNFIKPSENIEGDSVSPPLVIACSSDRGLCGAIHSSISKLAKKEVRDRPSTSIVVLGDKAKPQIAREARKQIVMHFNQVGRNIPTFLDASEIANVLIQRKLEYSIAKIMYNAFKSVISYTNTTLLSYPERKLLSAEGMSAFEVDDDSLENYYQFLLASQLFWALSEGHASEMAAKRTAMENATKNAGEIIVRLTMKYNRTRQAVITNELVDIITGASAL